MSVLPRCKSSLILQSTNRRFSSPDQIFIVASGGNEDDNDYAGDDNDDDGGDGGGGGCSLCRYPSQSIWQINYQGLANLQSSEIRIKALD